MRNFLRSKLFRNMIAERLRIEIELRTALIQCFCLTLAHRWVSARTTQDWTHQLLDVSIESECLCHGCRSATTRRELFLSIFLWLSWPVHCDNREVKSEPKPARGGL